MTDDELAQLIQRVVADVDRTGPEGVDAAVRPLRDAGLTANMNLGDAAKVSRRATLEWYGGQILQIVEEQAWFAMNSLINACSIFTEPKDQHT